MKLSECAVDTWWCGWISFEVLGALTWIGFVLTLLGIGFAIYKILAAQTKAEATAQAIMSVKNRDNAVHASYLNAQLTQLEQFTNDQRYSEAQTLFSPLRRDLRKQSERFEQAKSVSSTINRNIDTVLNQIRLGANNNNVNTNSLSKSLDALSEMVSRWETMSEKLATGELKDE